MLNAKRIKIELRDIAKMLTKNMPIQDGEFTDKVEANLKTIKKLDKNAKLALASAYVFSSKCPRQDREDLFQDITLAILKSGTKDEPLAYSIARCDWRDWWEKRYSQARFTGETLDALVEDSDGVEIRASELLVGEVEFEAKEVDYLSACDVWKRLPKAVKPMIQKRLQGLALTGAERAALCRFTKSPKAQAILATIQS